MSTQSGFVGSFVDNGNARLYYELAGEGYPIVMIHANIADRRQWNDAFDDFARDYQVLRYDLRGHGKSLPVDGEFSDLGDLTALLDHLAFSTPVVLIGCSMGGSMAMDFALAEPARVKALVMVSSAPSGLFLDVAINPAEYELEEAYEAGDVNRVLELGAQIWFDGLGRTAQQVDRSKRNLLLEMNRLVLSHDAKKLGKRLPDSDVPAAERLEDLTIPVLILVGAHDDAFVHAAADYMVDHLPSARKVVMQDAAHMLNMEHPELFQRTVRSFLDDVAAQPTKV